MLVFIVAFVTLTFAPTPVPRSTEQLRIVVTKSQRRLELFSGDRLLRTYRVGLGLNPAPAKRRAGDNATPEGRYRVTVKNAQSRYYLSLGLSYPGPDDAARGLRDGLITRKEHDQIAQASKHGRTRPWNTALGGEIFIHGRGASSDWTWGCIALEDSDIRELFRVVSIGTPVEIFH